MPPKVSPAEWEVLNVLWDHSPATVQEICERLPDSHDWHPKTVGTFLTRLVEKGVLDVRREGKVNFYTPCRSREECVRDESESFLKRVFRGASAPLLAHFVEEAELSPQEILELEQLLKQKKQQMKPGKSS